MYGFGELISVLKKNPKTIVFTEGTDPRILEASSRLLASNFLHPILIGNEDEIYKGAEESGFNIRGALIIDPENYDRFDEMVDLFFEIRKSKGVTPEEARKILKQPNYFGTMLVKMGVADSLLGGSTYSTADTVRPALQMIDLHQRNVVGDRESFGERYAHQKRSQQTGAARESDRVDLVDRHAGLFQGRIDYRDDILLVGPGC